MVPRGNECQLSRPLSMASAPGRDPRQPGTASAAQRAGQRVKVKGQEAFSVPKTPVRRREPGGEHGLGPSAVPGRRWKFLQASAPGTDSFGAEVTLCDRGAGACGPRVRGSVAPSGWEGEEGGTRW